MRSLPCRIFLAFAVAVTGMLAVVAGVEACSICRCGDATFNALGKAGYTTPGYRTALDWERFDKDEGDPADEAESQVENRVTALLSYGFNDRFMLSARVPYSHRDLTGTVAGEDPEKIKTNGLSDPEIYGQVLLWSSGMTGMGRRECVSLSAGVKTPWGENDVTQDGARVDEHGQPGTGSTDLFGSLAVLHIVDMNSSIFASTGYRHTGENDFGYRYGSTFLASAAYERKFAGRFDGVVELDFRSAEKDRVDADGTLGDNTGGSLLYVTPRMLVSLGRGIVLRASAQIPTARDLNGTQTERTVANVGLTFLLDQ